MVANHAATLGICTYHYALRLRRIHALKHNRCLRRWLVFIRRIVRIHYIYLNYYSIIKVIANRGLMEPHG